MRLRSPAGSTGRFQDPRDEMTCKAITQPAFLPSVNKNYEGRPNILTSSPTARSMIVNTRGKGARHDDSYPRKAAIKAKIPYVTTRRPCCQGISHLNRKGSA